MSNLLSLEDINSRLDELDQTVKDLETEQKKIETEKKQMIETQMEMTETQMEMAKTQMEMFETEMRDSLQKSTTSEKRKIVMERFNTLNNKIVSINTHIVASDHKIMAINHRIVRIENERSELLDLIKEQGRFLIYFWSSLFIWIYLYEEESPLGKKMRRSFPIPTDGSQWTYEILNALLIDFKDVHSMEEFLFDRAPNISGRCFVIENDQATSIESFRWRKNLFGNKQEEIFEQY